MKRKRPTDHRDSYVGPCEMIAKVYDQFKDDIGGRFCIAGGAVRDRLAGLPADDFDLFCFDPPNWRRLFANYEASADQQHRYRDMTCLTLYWRQQKVQVIWRKGLTTIPSLLDEFDWCICQWAYDGVAIRGIDSSETVRRGGVMHLANPQDAEKSLARGYRFAERFGMKIDRAAEEMLVEKVNGSKRLEVVRKLVAESRAMRRAAA